MKTILCFGDSNTLGYRPDGTGRFEWEVRWPGVLQKELPDAVRGGTRQIRRQSC
jgi:lysophospholipase L1-like esterase